MGQARSSENKTHTVYDNTPENVFRVVVKLDTGQKLLIGLCDTEEQFKTITVLQLKEKLREHTGRSPDESHILFAGQQLEDHRLLCDYGIQHMTELQELKRLRGGGPLKGDRAMADKDKSQSSVDEHHYSSTIQPVKIMDRATRSQKKNSKKIFQVVVCRITEEKLLIDLCNTEEQFKTITVLQLKEKIREHIGVPRDQSRIIFGGQQLEDDRLLCDYGIQHMTELVEALKLRGGGTLKGDGGIGDKDKSQSMERLATI